MNWGVSSAVDCLSLNWNCVIDDSSILNCLNWGVSSVVNSLSSSDVSSLILSGGMNFSFKRLFRVVNNLSFNWEVFVFLNFSFLGDVFDSLFGNVLWDVLSEIFNGVVVSFGNFSWDGLNSLFLSVFCNSSGSLDSFDSDFILIFDDFLFEGNVLDSAFSLNDLLSSAISGVNDLRCLNVTDSCGGITSGSITSGIDRCLMDNISAVNRLLVGSCGLVGGGLIS